MTPYVWIIIIAIVSAYAIISGYMKGLLSQVGQIAGLITGILASRAFTPSLLQALDADAGLTVTPFVARVACYSLVFLAADLSVIMLARMVKLVVRVACLGTLDRIGGALFKLLKWGLILSLVYNLCASINVCQPPGEDSNPVERAVYGMAPALLDMWHNKTS